MTKMKRLEKLEGFGNVQMVEAEVPSPGPDEVLVKVHRSLISRGSELFRRYTREESVSPNMMGYSDAGEVVEAGADVETLSVGDRVKVSAPHAQYVVRSVLEEGPWVFPLPDGLSYEEATFLPLAAGAVAWSRATPIEPGDTVVVQGQGLVGNLYAQAVRERSPGRVVTVDALGLRCDTSRACGADVVINVSEQDSVEAIRGLTDGRGADVVVECVGGHAGERSFRQAMQTVKDDGVVHLIALYQDGPLPLDSGLMMNKQLVGGYWRSPGGASLKDTRDAAQMILDGRIKVAPLITHRLPWREVAEAYHMLYRKPEEALGVILEWA